MIAPEVRSPVEPISGHVPEIGDPHACQTRLGAQRLNPVAVVDCSVSDRFGRNRRFQAPDRGGQGAAELADLFWDLRRLALQSAGSDQSGEREAAGAGLDLSDGQGGRWFLLHSPGGGRSHVHHHPLEPGLRAGCRHRQGDLALLPSRAQGLRPPLRSLEPGGGPGARTGLHGDHRQPPGGPGRQDRERGLERRDREHAAAAATSPARPWWSRTRSWSGSPEAIRPIGAI